MGTWYSPADVLTLITVTSGNVLAEVVAFDVDVVVPPPAPFRAGPVAGDVEAELGVPVFESQPEVTLSLEAGLFALIEGLEEVDGLGEVVVPNEVDDVLGEGLLVGNGRV